MYIESVPNRNSLPAVLLRESYRGEDGKVKKRTVANLSSLKPEVIEGLRVLLKGGSVADKPLEEQFKVERTLPHGHVAAALNLFSKLGMFPLLERKRSEERSLAAALIVSRLLDPGSKLALSRQLSRRTATSTLGEELGLEEKVGEKDLYRAMAWLLDRQDKIERRLAKKHLSGSDPILYDLSSTYYEALKECDGIAWISALQNAGVRQLVRTGAVQMELFDKQDLVEIRSEKDFPGERLVVCMNPALREERARKRTELLEVTWRKLQEISDACTRSRNPYRGKDRIARRVEREAGKYKMLKHFKLSFSETGLDFERDESSIDEESALDGLYVVRAKEEGTAHMDEAQLVRTYKSLSGVESAFRSIKTETPHVRPVFHRQEDMVRAHIFICMLAYHLQWHLTKALNPVLFEDEVPGGAPRSSPVAKARRSEAAEIKAARKQSKDGLCIHGFKTLLEELATLFRVTIRPDIKNADAFFKLTEPTQIQEKVFDLLEFKPQIAPCSQQITDRFLISHCKAVAYQKSII